MAACRNQFGCEGCMSSHAWDCEEERSRQVEGGVRANFDIVCNIKFISLEILSIEDTVSERRGVEDGGGCAASCRGAR
jgi:hypothetical protein